MNYFRKNDQIYLSLAATDLLMTTETFKEKVIDSIPFGEINLLHLAVQEGHDLNVVSFSVIMNLTHFLRNRKVAVHFKAPKSLHALLKKLNLNTGFASFSQAD